MTSPSPAVSGLTPEERCDKERRDRVKMALAEAGYPKAIPHLDTRPHRVVGLIGCRVPLPVFWRACMVAGEPIGCWPCWQAAPHSALDAPNGWLLKLPECDHDPATSPWPPLPSRPTIAGPTEEP